MKTWTATSLPADRMRIRARWSGFHALRTFLLVAGLAALDGSG